MRNFHRYECISLNEAAVIPAEVVCELVGALRYLDCEQRNGFPIDAVNMAYVTKVLARVDAVLAPAPLKLAAE